jgi:hypothetical protein
MDMGQESSIPARGVKSFSPAGAPDREIPPDSRGRTVETAAAGRRILGWVSLAGLAAASVLVVAGSQSEGVSELVPASKLRYPGWLHGPLGWLELDLSLDGLAVLLLVLFASYLGVLAAGGAISPRVGIAAIAGLHLLFVLAPPLLSSDVFGYVDLGRLGAVHGIDPYSPTGTDVPQDEVRLYRRWGSDLPSPYGPLFTALLYPLGPLGVPAAFWVLKAILGAASLATVALVWRCAERLGRDPLPAALFVGLNPILLVWGVGGAHNDFLLGLALTGAIALSLAERERPAAAALVAAVAVKASAALPLAFMVAGARDRREALRGVLIAAGALAVLAAAFFGTDVVRLVDAIREQQDKVALFSFPNQLGEWLGFGGITDGIRAAAVVILGGGVLWLLARTWQGTIGWIAAAGWATAVLLITSAWLLPWYLVWLLPLAALADDRRLRAVALAIGAFVIYTRVDLWFELG